MFRTPGTPEAFLALTLPSAGPDAKKSYPQPKPFLTDLKIEKANGFLHSPFVFQI
jgi:hypothetical protein